MILLTYTFVSERRIKKKKRSGNGGIRERILDYLKQHPEGTDDDKIAFALKLKHRQQANIRCRQLALEGLIERKPLEGKIYNFWRGHEDQYPRQHEVVSTGSDNGEPWYWEGNIQQSIAEYLREQGYSIKFIADTKTRQRGKDIATHKGTTIMWVTAKGYPKGTAKTSPSTQAGHWFKQTLYDILSWRGEDSSAELAFALPDFPRYRKLSEKVMWVKTTVRFSFMWVKETGSVEVF